MKTVPFRLAEAALVAAAVTAGLAITASVGGVSAVNETGVAASPAAHTSGLRESYIGELLDVTIETASGSRIRFAATDGRLRIATMFYTHCPGVCPLTISNLKQLESQLSAAERTQVEFVLLSLDPAHDSPAALRALARERGIDSPGWLLGRTSEADTQRFAAAANVRYRHLSDGSVDHSSTVLLVDPRGRVVTRSNETDGVGELLSAVRTQLRGDHVRR